MIPKMIRKAGKKYVQRFFLLINDKLISDYYAQSLNLSHDLGISRLTYGEVTLIRTHKQIPRSTNETEETFRASPLL